MIILGIVGLWLAFFSVGGMPSWLDFKPFNCHVCLSFWSVLCLYLIKTIAPYTATLIDSVCMGGYAAYCAILFKRILFKI